MREDIAVHVRVTRKDITEAVRQEARNCAIARAIVASDPDIAHVNVTTDFIKIARHSTERVTAYRTPKPARDFIIAFDNNRAPKPFDLVVTEDAFVSERPRQMHQQEKRVQVEQRRSVAAATGRKLREVAPEEASDAFDAAGWANPTKTKRERVIRPAVPSKAKRPYARRETAAEAFRRNEKG